jgi:hypothetical protein
MSLLAGWLFKNGVAQRARMLLVRASNGVVDIETVVLRQGRRLDVGYIRRWLREFSDLLANPEVLERFEQAFHKLKLK